MQRNQRKYAKERHGKKPDQAKILMRKSWE